MEELIVRFLNFLLKEKVAAANTIDAYGCDLRQFVQFLKSRPKRVALQEIDRGMITDYLEYLERKGPSAATLKRKFAALRSFFKYLAVKRVLKANPLEDMKILTRRVEFRPQSVTTEKMEALLEIPRRFSTKEAKRDLVMVELLWTTGIRITELISLDMPMLNLESENPSITVRHNGRERTIPIPFRTVQALKQYLEEIRPALVSNKSEKALFVSRRGRRLTRYGFWIKLRKYAKAAGLESSISPETIRHSFIFRQLAAGTPLKELQEQLGHTNLETTSKYQRILQAQKTP